MYKSILILTVLAGLGTAGFAEKTRTRVITATTLGAFSEDDESQIIQLLSVGDEEGKQAVIEMCEQGKAVTLEEGATVYFIDVDYTLGLCRVRIAGSAQTVWIPSDALSGD